MADWANILGSAFTGLAGGLQTIEEQRRQQAELQLQQRQQQELERKNAIDLYLRKLEAIPHDTDVDEDTLKQGATLGLAGMFRRDPTSGGFRRVPSLTERANLLDMEATSLEKQINELRLGQTRTAMDPELSKTLLGLPLAERQVRAHQLGFKDVPMTPEEELEEAKRNPAYLASIADNQTALRVAEINKQQGLAGNKLSPEMVATIEANPDLVQRFSPLQRGQVIAAYSATTGKPFPNPRADQNIGRWQQTLFTVDQLLEHPGFAGAMGYPETASSLTRLIPGMGSFPGSKEADFEELLNQYKGQMTVDQLDVMRGLGHLSEREFQVMGQIGTAVSQRGNEAINRNRLRVQRQILAKMIERAQSGRRVTDQTDLFAELNITPESVLGGNPSYRRVGTTVYKER